MASNPAKWLQKLKAKVKRPAKATSGAAADEGLSFNGVPAPDRDTPSTGNNTVPTGPDGLLPDSDGLPPTILECNGGKTTHVAISSAGDRVASISTDMKLRIWDAVARTSLLTLSLDCTAVHGLAMSQRDRLVAVAVDSCIKVWHLDKATTNSKPQKTHKLHSPVDSVAFSPDGSLLACGATDDIYLWKLPSHTLHLSVEITSDAHNVLFSMMDGLMYTSKSGEIIFHEREWQRISHGKGERVTCVAISPDGKWVATGSATTERVRIWQRYASGSWTPVKSYELRPSAATSLAFLTASDTVVAGSASGIWELGVITKSQRLAWPCRGATSVVASPVCSCIVAGADDGNVRIFSTMSAKEVSKSTLQCLHGNFSAFQTLTMPSRPLVETLEQAKPEAAAPPVAAPSAPTSLPSTPSTMSPQNAVQSSTSPASAPTLSAPADPSSPSTLPPAPTLSPGSTSADTVPQPALKPLGQRSASATVVLPSPGVQPATPTTGTDPFASASADGTYHPPPETYFNPTNISSTKSASYYLSPRGSYKEPRKCYMCLGYVEHVPNSTEMCRCK